MSKPPEKLAEEYADKFLFHDQEEIINAYLAGFTAGRLAALAETPMPQETQWTLVGDRRPPDGALCLVHFRESGSDVYDYDVALFEADGPDWRYAERISSAHDDESYIILREKK